MSYLKSYNFIFSKVRIDNESFIMIIASRRKTRKILNFVFSFDKGAKVISEKIKYFSHL